MPFSGASRYMRGMPGPRRSRCRRAFQGLSGVTGPRLHTQYLQAARPCGGTGRLPSSPRARSERRHPHRDDGGRFGLHREVCEHVPHRGWSIGVAPNTLRWGVVNGA